jgi:hypothetical protein
MFALFLLLALAAPAAGVPEVHHVMMRPPEFTCELAADSVVVPMRIVGGHIRVDVMLNGKGPFQFVFDTGAAGSVMDLAFAKEQGLALGSEVMVGSPNGGGRPGRMTKLDTLRIGGLTTRGMTTIAFDGLPFPPGPDAPHGVIGPYGMNGLLVTLDYPRQRLVFRRGALPAPDSMQIFGWDRSRPLPEIPVKLAGMPMRVHLDSGSSGSVGVPVSLEGKLPMAGPLVEMGHAKSVDRDVVTRGAKLNGDLVIGRWTLQQPTVRFSDVQREVGNIGSVILRQFAITIDPANARLKLDGPVNGKLTEMADTPPKP